jgi:hypothetical protein
MEKPLDQKRRAPFQNHNLAIPEYATRYTCYTATLFGEHVVYKYSIRIINWEKEWQAAHLLLDKPTHTLSTDDVGR